MEAVSRGVSESGGRVIGVTCDEIEVWRPGKPNPWVQEERRYATLRERLFALIDGCDAVIALPGGVGTLAEISIFWSQLQVGSIEQRKLILVGEGWQAMMDTFIGCLGKYVPETTQAFVTYATNVETAYSKLIE
jgi:predicted Rossmann-fold nucleotide-binding protein